MTEREKDAIIVQNIKEGDLIAFGAPQQVGLVLGVERHHHRVDVKVLINDTISNIFLVADDPICVYRKDGATNGTSAFCKRHAVGDIS